jgi:glycosyltransferase involved in cell wall biosynthesis/SAM-dependent methyltransferase
MHVGLLIYGSLETISGGYLYDRRLVDYLRRQGDQVEVISLPWRNYLHHLGDNLSSRLLHRLKSLRVDVLLQDELNHPSLFWLNRRLKNQATYPILSIVHHLRCSEARPSWQNWIYRQVESRYLETLDGFIFNSQTTRQAVASLLPQTMQAERPFLVATPSGDRFDPQIDAQAISQRSFQTGPLQILFLGNLIPRKGLHTLLKALTQLPASDWRLSVVGSPGNDTGYAGRMRQFSERAGLSGRVTFHGALDNDTLAQLLRSSHLLAVPSSYEGFGIVYLEGMGFGLPEIATTSGAAGEIITHGQDGFLITPGDSQALADHLNCLAKDRDRLREMSLAARRRYQAQPTWDDSMGAVRKFLLLQTTAGESELAGRAAGIDVIPSDFSFERYLSAKKSVDDRALNRHVWECLTDNLPAGRTLQALEVGAGIGTMIERMLEWGALHDAEYTAIDADEVNISAAYQRLKRWGMQNGVQVNQSAPDGWLLKGEDIRLTIRLQAIDLFDFIREHAGKRQWDLLVAHAFLDLIDIPSTLPHLVKLVRPGGLFYFTVNFDGATIFQPEIDPDFDALVERCYHRSMDERITAGCPSGDSRSGRHLFRHLSQQGLRLLDAGASDWVVFAGKQGYQQDEAYFLHFILHTMQQALQSHPDLEARRFSAWIAERRAQVARGELVYIAHQLDLLAQVPEGISP